MPDDNDGSFPDDSPVEIRYPRSRQEEHGDRSAWPWPPVSIVEQCGPDELYVCASPLSLPRATATSQPEVSPNLANRTKPELNRLNFLRNRRKIGRNS